MPKMIVLEEESDKYKKVSFQRCKGGWVVSEEGKDDQVITDWRLLRFEFTKRMYPEATRQ